MLIFQGHRSRWLRDPVFPEAMAVQWSPGPAPRTMAAAYSLATAWRWGLRIVLTGVSLLIGKSSRVDKCLVTTHLLSTAEHMVKSLIMCKLHARLLFCDVPSQRVMSNPQKVSLSIFFLFTYFWSSIWDYYVNAKYMLVNKNKYCPFHTCK